MIMRTFNLEVHRALIGESFSEYPQAALSVQSARLGAEDNPGLAARDQRGVKLPSFTGHRPYPGRAEGLAHRAKSGDYLDPDFPGSRQLVLRANRRCPKVPRATPSRRSGYPLAWSD